MNVKVAFLMIGMARVLVAEAVDPARACGSDWAGLAVEMRQLRLELLEDRLSKETKDVENLEREVQQTREDRRLLSAGNGNPSQPFRHLDEQLSDSSLDPRVRAQIETMKAEGMASNQEKLTIAHADLAIREAELAQRLSTAKARRQKLIAKFQQLSPAR